MSASHVFAEDDLVHQIDVDQELLVAPDEVRPVLEDLEGEFGVKLAGRRDHMHPRLSDDRTYSISAVLMSLILEEWMQGIF